MVWVRPGIGYNKLDILALQRSFCITILLSELDFCSFPQRMIVLKQEKCPLKLSAFLRVASKNRVLCYLSRHATARGYYEVIVDEVGLTRSNVRTHICSEGMH